MDSVEGQLEEYCGENLFLVPECGKDQGKARIMSQISSEVADSLWADEVDSTLRLWPLKWKSSVQTGDMVCNLEADLINDDMESKWQDLPVELLVRILTSLDDRTVIIASGVCSGWRDAMCFGILELSFSWCKQNTSKLVQSVAPKFTRLRVCNLRNSPQLLNDQAVEALANHCHDLLSLDLANSALITDASLSALAHGCPMLERLNLSGCIRTSELGLTILAENCNNLMHLNLCGCKNAGDQALLALARNCVRLQSLTLGWCDKVTDAGVIGLASWCSDLTVVDLCGCLLITDQSVMALADQCHHLRVLDLYSCIHITDTAMYALANSSKYRVVKSIPKCNSICHNSQVLTHTAAVTSTGSCSSTGSNGSSSSSCSDGNTIMSRDYFESLLNEQERHGLISLNVGMCAHLSAPAVQAVCDAFPGLHTCPEKHSLIISGCLNLIGVHCLCVVKAAREKKRISQNVFVM